MRTRNRLAALQITLSLALAWTFTACTRQQPNESPGGGFVGSAACEACHEPIYDRWKKTLMANIVVDPKEKPDWNLGDFSQPNPLVTFKQEDIAFTYGHKWKQRYFTKIGDDYFVFPAQWDVAAKTWRRYYPAPGADWWVEFYPDDQMKRPTGPLCDGCHSTNYDIKTKQVTEWNVGCEKCHGAGGAHVKNPRASNIVNPEKLDYVRGADVCIQCHSQGQPLSKPLDGVYYDWPVGYQAGGRLRDFWTLEEHKLGEESFTHYMEGSAHKNRMQGNDYVTSRMYEKGVRCWSCHDVHGTDKPADTVEIGNALCLKCHAPGMPNGPGGTIEEHTHHAIDSTGSSCVACHAPKIARTIANESVRSHTFRFTTPSETTKYQIPNPCTTCHADKSLEWATGEMAKWREFSPWRMER